MALLRRWARARNLALRRRCLRALEAVLLLGRYSLSAPRPEALAARPSRVPSARPPGHHDRPGAHLLASAASGLVSVPTTGNRGLAPGLWPVAKWWQNAAMATTLRIPDALQTEARRYADSLGLSMNGLIAVALRDYLDARQGKPLATSQEQAAGLRQPPAQQYQQRDREAQTEGPPLAGSGSAAPQPQQAIAVPAKTVRPPKNPRAPCPCGSGQQWRHCHGPRSRAPGP